jgi:hypothetical protein
MISEREDGLLKAYGVQQEEITELRKQLDAANQRIAEQAYYVGLAEEHWKETECAWLTKRRVRKRQRRSWRMHGRQCASHISSLIPTVGMLIESRNWTLGYDVRLSRRSTRRNHKHEWECVAPGGAYYWRCKLCPETRPYPDAPAAGPSDTERLNKLEEMLGFPGNCFINRNGKRIDHLLMSPSARGSSLHVTGSYSSLATLRETADRFIKLSRERAKEDAMQAEKEPHA